MRGLVRLAPWAVSGRLVEEHGTDAGVRRFSTRSQPVATPHDRLAGAGSLHEIGTAPSSHWGRLHRLGARLAARSTLADAERPAAAFTGPLGALMGQARRGRRRELARRIDPTSLQLAGLGTGWARFSAGVRGAEAHVAFGSNAARPLHLAVTPARVNDTPAAEATPITAGATHVLDLCHHRSRLMGEDRRPRSPDRRHQADERHALAAAARAAGAPAGAVP